MDMDMDIITTITILTMRMERRTKRRRNITTRSIRRSIIRSTGSIRRRSTLKSELIWWRNRDNSSRSGCAGWLAREK